MEHSLHLPPEDFDYVVGKNGLHAYALAFGPPIEACPHMQGSAFYYLVDSPEARQCKKCGDWFCSVECQKKLWEAHQERCFDRNSPLPISARGLGHISSGSQSNQIQSVQTADMPFGGSFTNLSHQEPQGGQRMNLDVSDALKRGIPNKNALEKRPAYDQLTPALCALFGRHAFASQRLIWCDTKSTDEATKKARKLFAGVKSNWPEVMAYAHSKFLATRMRGALIMNLDTPSASGDYLLGRERFNWLTYPDAQMTLCVKLQEVVKAYDPSRAFVLVVYALSPNQLSAALWVWTYTQFSNGDPLSCEQMRPQIRQIMKDTKRAEKYMYTVNKDQNDI